MYSRVENTLCASIKFTKEKKQNFLSTSKFPRILGGMGCVLKNTNWWNTLAAFHTSMHLPLLSQCAAANMFILILQASSHLWFDHLKNGAKEKKQHEMDGLQGQSSVELICPGRYSVTRNDRVHGRRAYTLELNKQRWKEFENKIVETNKIIRSLEDIISLI